MKKQDAKEPKDLNFKAASRRAGIFRAWLLCFIVVLLFAPARAKADDEVMPPPPPAASKAGVNMEDGDERLFNTGIPFFDEADFGGGLYYFQRRRDRYDVTEDKWKKNLDHGSFQAAAHFDSGFAGEEDYLQLGMDVGWYMSFDFWNNAGIDHEMNFVPWPNPWRMDWSDRDTVNGSAIYKASLKLQAGPENRRAWLRAGYLQPTGPGVLGVNWSILPGTYQGLEAGTAFGGLEPQGQDSGWGKLELAAMITNAYKAPWYKKFYPLRKRDGETRVDHLWSLGARYSRNLGDEDSGPATLTLELAYGQAENYLKNFHFKSACSLPLGPGTLDLKYHFYGMLDGEGQRSPNDNFSGLARQHYAGAFYNLELWSFRLEYTYTRVPWSNENQLGYFAYRLTNPTGSSKGAYDIWWDARSDWSHDREMAAFAGASRGLDDLLPFRGLTLGLGGAFGWDGKAYSYSQRLKEYAWTGDIIYVVPEGPLQGASVSFHYTRYYNKTDIPSWDGYKNAFQDEEDFKFLVCVPF